MDRKNLKALLNGRDILESWVSSDHHFGHKNILKHQARTRPAADIEDMDRMLVDHHNELVKPDDFVIFLGDLAWNYSDKQLEDLLDRLNGTIALIPGNHDDRLLRSASRVKKLNVLPEVTHYKRTDLGLAFCHYPLESWRGQGHGSIHLHGHCHGNLRSPHARFRRKDIGVDTNDLYPYHLGVVVEQLMQVDISTTDHH